MKLQYGLHHNETFPHYCFGACIESTENLVVMNITKACICACIMENIQIQCDFKFANAMMVKYQAITEVPMPDSVIKSKNVMKQ